MNLISLLIERGAIDETVASRVRAEAEGSGSTYEHALVEAGVSPELIRKTIGEYFDLPTREFKESEKVPNEALKYFPAESAEHYRAIPLGIANNVLEIGVTDPENLALRDALNFITAKYNIPYKLIVLLESDFEHAYKSYENLSGEVGEALGALDADVTFDEEEGKESLKREAENIKEDAPVTKVVATILRYAVDGGASDIHIEPGAEKVVVRFRVDGILSRSLELPPKVKSAVVARVKILASLRLDEKRKPQDGRFSATIDGRKIDFRVSILPTNYGEKVVMRILDTEKGVATLEATGISEHNVALLRKAIRQPYGIILISGPTGSGKSTTLYALLSEVDRVGKNVLSLEDPVEYNIDGVSQSQVRPEIGYTFANGLRTALRQDPDVIMVGEIRDKETAQLAIQAALTGHLVLSTIHTNNAIGVIPRLIDMGVDPYLIAPTLQLAIAQRLVRRICPGTGIKMPLTKSMRMMIDHEFETLPETYRPPIPQDAYVLRAESTPECSSGTKGRVAVMETVEITERIEQLILSGGSEEQMYEAARQSGFVTMKEDSIMKALDHLIPFEEVNTLGGALLTSDEAEEEAKNEPETHEPEPVDNQLEDAS